MPRSIATLRRFARLHLGRLEDRRTPATLTVNSLLDEAVPANGAVSLRSALIAANLDAFTDVINFAPGFHGIMNLISPLPTLTAPVQLNGPGEASLTLKAPTTGGLGQPIIGVNPGISLSMSGITVDGSNRYVGVQAGAGAAISMTNCVVQACSNPGGTGGGVSNYGGTVLLDGCTVKDSGAHNGGGVGSTGGSMTLKNTTVTNNRGAVTGAGTGGGGGVYVHQSNDGTQSGGALTIINSAITDNTTSNGGVGGGVGIDLHTVSTVTLLIANSTIAGNSANGFGGGIFVASLFNGNSPPITVTNCTIAANTLTSATTNGVPTTGGGIYADYSADLILRDTVVAKNTNSSAVADDLSGIADSAGHHNLIGIDTGMTGLINGFNGNLVGSVFTAFDPKLGPLQNNGGATDTMLPLPGSPLIDHGYAEPTVDALTAFDQRGLARLSHFASAPLPYTSDGRDIGAVEVQAAAPTILTVNSLSDVVTPPAGDLTLRQAIQAANGTMSLGSLPAARVQAGSPYQTVIQFSVGGTITLTSALPTLAAGTRLLGPGADALTIVAPANASAGQVEVTVAPGVQVSLIGLTLNGNKRVQDVQVSDAAVLNVYSCHLVNGSNAGAYGGAIGNLGGTVAIDGGTVANNVARGGGGLATRGGSLSIINSAIVGNAASIYGGGGIFVHQSADGSQTGGALTIVSSAIAGNTAASGGNGGGIAFDLHTISSVSLLIANSTIANNTATLSGGGIYLVSLFNGNSPALTVTNSTLAGNAVTGTTTTGGGIYVDPAAKLILHSTVVAKNTRLNNVADDVNGPVAATSEHCLLGVSTGMTGLTHGINNNIVGTPGIPIDPKLGLMQYNGGPTSTMMPLTGSPCIAAGSNLANFTTDQRGRSRISGGVPNGHVDIGAYEGNPPAKYISTTINNGEAQRSRVTSLKIAFDAPVGFGGTPSNAISLVRQSDNASVTFNVAVDSVGASSVVTLTFVGGAVDGVAGNYSLADGRYTLSLLGNQFKGDGFDGNSDGVAGDNYTLIGTPANGLFRLFGDYNGDGTVNGVDFLQFRLAFQVQPTSPMFDFNGDGQVSGADFLQFRLRFQQSI